MTYQEQTAPLQAYHPIWSSHAPQKNTKAATIIAIGLTIAIHLGIGAYFLSQKFLMPPVAPIESDPIFDAPIVSLTPKPETQKPAPNPIRTHDPLAPATTTTPPLEIKHVTGPDAPSNALPSLPTVSDPISGSGTSEPVFIKPIWAQFPDSETLTDYYPEQALTAERGGEGKVECAVLDEAGRVACHILSEKPGGYGFGEATKRMIEAVGRVDTGHGNVKIGSLLVVSVKWQLPN